MAIDADDLHAESTPNAADLMPDVTDADDGEGAAFAFEAGDAVAMKSWNCRICTRQREERHPEEHRLVQRRRWQ